MPQPPALPELPILDALPALLEAVERTGTAVLAAPPGTGKTTLAPLALAGLVPAGAAASHAAPQRRVLVAEPRRLATRAAATRMAAILGERVGERVGYQIRGESRRSAATRVEVVTTGVLLNRLLADPELPGVDLVVLDECHERHLETDTACAFLAETRQVLRPDLALVAASATVDIGLWTALLAGEDGPAPAVSSEPMRHPVQMHWAPSSERVSAPDGMRVDPRFLAHVAHVVERALDDGDGDALVFLPGAAEIRRVAERLAHLQTENLGFDIYQLHGSIASSEQDRALAPADRDPARRGGRRKVVLATDIAESSLTVPGVRIVVDAGLARRPLVDHARGLPGLTTAYASRASADQRAGRAGREGPGAVWRCWSEAEHLRRAAQPAPDIACSDLTAFRLQAACWGTPVEDLALPGPPPAGALEAAEATLRSLGALDADGAATARGRALARMGLHPRLARALMDGAERVGTEQAAEVAALLGLDRRGKGDDLLAQWRQLRATRDRQWRREVERLTRGLASARQAHRDAGESPGPEPAPPPGPRIDAAPRRRVSDDEAAATVIALAFPERVAKRRQGAAFTPVRGQSGTTGRPGGATGTDQWRTVAGTGAVVAAGSSLAGSAWLAIAEADRSPGRAAALIRAAVPIDGELACELVGDSIGERVAWDPERRDVTARTVRSLGAIEVASKPLRRADPALVTAALAEGLRIEGLGLLHWTEETRRLRERMAFCHRRIGEPWPDVSDAALAGGTDWLEPWWSRARRRSDVERIPVGQALRNLLPWQARIDEAAPESLAVPSGREARVDYSGETPVLAVKLQEMFGAVDTPRIADVPVLLHLLSPAGRPLAVTADLKSFWEGPYQDVRKEMRGRYPKHPWPEDPYSVAPTARTKRRLR
ncbi:ATP-dependent helicase HrpB [Glycomyces sp. TRM65418]|uniref:ATP-dependent helicase HrpB n=1 Tax=Glycomyces sp. TRM65418 TaxID=2867006 RepID=UPI001D16D2C6|nr:ATP-dependent helicase HrpB [Glycomyces sp. TRM65418]MCC3763161.1 ATP-dependent helicase HrpB [Glycomyces sp. TRM65418]